MIGFYQISLSSSRMERWLTPPLGVYSPSHRLSSKWWLDCLNEQRLETMSDIIVHFPPSSRYLLWVVLYFWKCCPIIHLEYVYIVIPVLAEGKRGEGRQLSSKQYSSALTHKHQIRKCSCEATSCHSSSEESPKNRCFQQHQECEGGVSLRFLSSQGLNHSKYYLTDWVSS